MARSFTLKCLLEGIQEFGDGYGQKKADQRGHNGEGLLIVAETQYKRAIQEGNPGGTLNELEYAKRIR